MDRCAGYRAFGWTLYSGDNCAVVACVSWSGDKKAEEYSALAEHDVDTDGRGLEEVQERAELISL
jgi:hypothetical protein